MPDWLRPDQSKAIVMLDRLRWNGQPAIVAVAVGAYIPQRTLDWLQQYAQLHGRPLLWEEYEREQGAFTGRKRIGTHGPKAFEADMMAKFRAGEVPW